MKKLLIASYYLCALSSLLASQPNVIVIMADDLGYEDLGFQGSKTVKTPHLDALAASGIRFTDAHTAASVCSPSRAGFITGRYQQRFGFEANTPPNGKGMDTEEYTMAQAMKSQGYKTYLVGKWHLGNNTEHNPINRGFDEFWGLREGSRNYFCKPNEKFNAHSIEHNGEHVKFKGYLSDRMTDQAIRMIDSDKTAPFFLFLSYTAPHAPLQATKEDLAKADGDPYHALIQNMDTNIGRLLSHLDDAKRRSNTIIWFLSDNGGTAKQASNRPLNGKKGIKFEGGQRVPFVLSWPAQIKSDQTYDKLTSAMDIFPTSFALAGGENTPKPLDGVNIYPNVTGETTTAPHDILYWKKLEGRAIRNGPWKMILSEGLEPMLYNLEDDLSERNNLAKQHPELVQQLTKEIEIWQKDHVQPWWVEADKWTKKRKKDYQKFRDAKDFLPL